jgi:hypothetical protein
MALADDAAATCRGGGSLGNSYPDVGGLDPAHGLISSGSDGGGSGGGRTASAARQARYAAPALLSLRLPPAQEEHYWRAAGTPALAAMDAWALLYTAFNV